MTIIYLILLFLFPVVSPLSAEDEIVVQLETEVQLAPIYLKVFNDSSKFDSAYRNSLEKVIQFDLNHNGMTQVIAQNGVLDQLIKNYDELAPMEQWSKSKVTGVVVGTLKKDTLSLKWLLVNGAQSKAINDVPLTGNLGEDRRKIHQLTDSLFKAVYGTEGVASTRILYALKTKGKDNKWLSEIYECDYDGENNQRTTEGQGYCVTPVYVPPKKGQISGSYFYVSYLNGQPKIFYSPLKQKKGSRLTLLPGNQLTPALSRQRDQIAYISDVMGNPDLFLQKIDPETKATEKPRQIFRAHRAVQSSPTFSPEGKKIAFVSNKDGYPRIYIMDIPSPKARLEDIKVQLLSKKSLESSAPNWSPDGTKIAYCAMTKGVRQIWIYDFNKKEERQITQGFGNKENPVWAPNSLHLAFNSTGNHGSELYILNLNQPEAIKISSGSGEKHYPCWEPR